MAKDPAFLFYPGDASEDTQFMNRLERGAYFDLLKAQKKFRRFTLEQIKKVLGQDFDACWPAIELVLAKDSDGYYIEWVDEKIKAREAFSESRRRNRKKKSSEQHMNNISSSLEEDMVNGNGNGIVIENGNGIENEKKPENPFGETLEDDLRLAFDDIYLETLRMNWRRDDFDFQLKAFVEKVRGSPNHYSSHGFEGLRLAFNRQLRESIPRKTTQKDIIAERKRKAKQL
jgi:hypothetical protein